jgi:hypothetical protein
MSAIASPDRLERPTYVGERIGLEILVGVMAVPVGLIMILDPDGNPVGIPHSWIADRQFGSYLVPSPLGGAAGQRPSPARWC